MLTTQTPESKPWSVSFWLYATLGSLAFALSYGLAFAISNQTTYLVHALTYFDPELLPRDWYTREAADLHSVFSHRVAWLFHFDAAPQIFAGLEILCTTAACLAIASLTRTMVKDTRDAVVAFAGWLVLAFVLRTNDVMSCYLFGGYLQPSSIGELGILWAMAFFARRRYLASGVALGLGGLFHLNFIVLGVVVFGVAQLLLPRSTLKEFVRRNLEQFALPFVVCVWALPQFLAAAAGGTEEAMDIVSNIRAGHHYKPSLTLLEPFFAWQAAAVIVVLGHWKKPAAVARNVWVLWVCFGGFVVVASLLTTVVHVKQILMILPWRIAPHATLFTQLLLLASALRNLREGAGVRPWLALATATAIAAGFGVAERDRSWIAALVAIVVVAAVAAFVARRFAGRFSWARDVAAVAVIAVATVFVGVAAEPTLSTFEPKIGVSANTEGLLKWVRSKSEKDALFAVPPGFIEFRLLGRRSIVVDWKSVGVNAKDVLEWYRRMNLIAGTRAFRSRSQAVRGYQQMDAARAERLRAELGVNYVVMPRDTKAELGTVVYRNRRWVVFQLAPPAG